MKRTFVHCAQLVLEAGADQAAPGGAVTVALCGSWDHPGPCRWPHHTSAVWDEDRGEVRVMFVASEEDEFNVRALINQALAGGECLGPDGKPSRWSVTSQGVGVLSSQEKFRGAKIAGFLAADS